MASMAWHPWPRPGGRADGSQGLPRERAAEHELDRGGSQEGGVLYGAWARQSHGRLIEDGGMGYVYIYMYMYIYIYILYAYLY